MPKDSVPRDTTANAQVKKKRLFEVEKKRINPAPKKLKPTLDESLKAFSDYEDALKYPSLFTPRGKAAPEKKWRGKKADAKIKNLMREGFVETKWDYVNERNAARDVRSDKSVGSRIKKIPAPIGKGGR